MCNKLPSRSYDLWHCAGGVGAHSVNPMETIATISFWTIVGSAIALMGLLWRMAELADLEADKTP